MDRTTWGILFVSFLCFMAIGAVVGGFLAVKLYIVYGLCGHPQCQPSAKNPAGDFPYKLPAIPGDSRFATLNNKEYTLMAERGPISDRLREQFPPDAPEWNPPRDESEPEAKPLPKGRDGWGITGRNKK